MAKFSLPKLNSWVTPLVLTSIGLHGLVLALPMPNLVEDDTDVPEAPDPEVIQVVTLPKLATTPNASEPSLPEPLTEEPPPEATAEDLVLVAPEIVDELEPVDEIEPEVAEDDFDLGEFESDLNEQHVDDGLPLEPTLDQRLASIDSYDDYNGAHTGTEGEQYANGKLIEWIPKADGYDLDLTPNHLAIQSLEIPLQECFQGNAPNSVVGVGVFVDVNGLLEGEPELLGSTGYSVLDEKALEIARQASYPATDVKKAYSIEIKVNYTRCS